MLYVGRAKANPGAYCAGSQKCIEALEQLSENVVVVQDCDKMRSMQFPVWLDGTPILVERASGQRMKGSEAVYFLQELATPQVEAEENEQDGGENPSTSGDFEPPEVAQNTIEDGFQRNDVDPESLPTQKVTAQEVEKLMAERNLK